MDIITKELVFDSKYYLDVIKIINSIGGNARVIGGAVRDAIVKYLPSDIDIATSLKPNEIIDLFQKHKIKTVPTGIKFGTVTVIIKNESFQVTTLRQDISCDGRHADVNYTNSYEEDAKRRDFTINALSYCPIKNEIYDYFGGYDDLLNQKVIFIGEANERIREDYLRILRFFRFSCKYSNDIDKAGFDACFNHRHMLTILSKERIKSEMDKILSLSNSPNILQAMDVCKILEIILPNMRYNLFMHQQIIDIAKYYNYSDYKNIIYALLFRYSGATVKNLIDLKFSKKDARTVWKMIEVSESEINIREDLIAIWLDESDYIQYFIFVAAVMNKQDEVRDDYNSLKDRERPVFPVSGEDLINMGFSGNDIGDILSTMRQLWICGNCNIDKENLMIVADSYAKHNIYRG